LPALEPTAQTKALYRLLGDLPDRDRPISARRLSTVKHDGYTLETLVLDLNGIEQVPAYFVKPSQPSGKLPAVLYNHAHGSHDFGKEELISVQGPSRRPPYAKVLTDLGYCALCIDTWNFGERRGRTESALFKEMLWKGRVLWGMMVYDSIRALDYLCSREDVDPQRIATLGMSMGSTMAWWTAALDERIRVCVDICCLTDFRSLIETDGLDGHGIYYYVPGLLREFETADINALIAPRAHLALAGNHDPLTPPAGLDIIDRHLRRVYAEQGVPERWQLRRYDTGHFETDDGRAAVIVFLQRWL